ncbi:MAG TPA: barstar family protein [Pseudonocardia sp.]|jgi:hypothetical protein
MRPLLFDPTAGDAFARQWQRYDWRLLSNGNVFRYRDAEGLRSAGAALAELGYLVRSADAAGWSGPADAHAGLAAALSFPDYYGANLDALRDVLRDLAEHSVDPATTGTALLISGYHRLVETDPGFAQDVLDEFAGAARLGLLLGHPMLCLVECATPLGPVGGMTVPLETAPPHRAAGADG